jgi:hypothetical protein
VGEVLLLIQIKKEKLKKKNKGIKIMNNEQ